MRNRVNLIERKAYDLIVYPSEFNSSIVLPEYLKSTKAISFLRENTPTSILAT